MKILLLGDASGFHATLGKALRALGHDVTIISSGSYWMQTPRDIDLHREKGLLGSIKYITDIFSELKNMRGYDIVQVPSPCFVELRPHRVRRLFDYLKKHNGKVIYEALGTDSNYVKACLDTTTFRYSDYRIGVSRSPYAEVHPQEELSWLKKPLREYTDYFVENVDAVIACLYEYHKVYSHICPQKLYYGGIPIDLSIATNTVTHTAPEKVRFVMGQMRGRRMLKGLDILLPKMNAVMSRNPGKAEFWVIKNLRYDRYIEEIKSFNVLIDQLYAYTPATNALLGMARGLIACSGAQDEFYDFIGEKELRPIVELNPLELYKIEEKFENLIKNKDIIPELSRQSREFVRKHNDSILVAKRHLEVYDK